MGYYNDIACSGPELADMDAILFLTLLALLTYGHAFAILLMRMLFIADMPRFRRRTVLLSTGAGILFHALALKHQLLQPEGQIILNFGLIVSLIGWSAALALLLISLTKPTEGLGIFVLPLAIAGILLPLLHLGVDHPLPTEYGAHALLALLAYALLGLAAAQAILFRIQERHFKRQELGRLIASLPPLQVMERTLYQLLIAGFVVLTLTLVTGALFIQDLLAQHLMHKTVFAILSWVIYAALLWGHFFRGWRGRKAATLTLVAFVLLALSYIGTQFVLEILLNRP